MPRLSLHRRSAVAAAFSAVLAPSLWAQDSAAIEYVIGFAPGSSADAIGRLIAEQMSKTLGRSIIVNNKPGAGTTIAAQYVATARAPMLFNADFATLATMPHLMGKIPYDPEKDFAPISLFARVPVMLAVSPSLPVNNLKEFIAWGKGQRDPVPYGSSGLGTPHHLAGELVKEMIGVPMAHVPYKGGGPAMNDLVAGQIAVAMLDVASAKAFVAAGKIRGIAVGSVQRSAALPDVPTFHEQGYPNFEATAWQALVASLATPADQRLKFQEALHAAMNSAPVKTRLDALGVEGIPGTPDQLMAFARTERARWGEVIRKHNIRID